MTPDNRQIRRFNRSTGTAGRSNKRCFVYPLTLIVLTVVLVDWARNDLSKPIRDTNLEMATFPGTEQDATTSATTETDATGDGTLSSSNSSSIRSSEGALSSMDSSLPSSPDNTSPTSTSGESSAGHQSSSSSSYTEYIPAPIEDYIIKNADALGYNSQGNENPLACAIWQDSNRSAIYNDLHKYREELRTYQGLLNSFSTSVTDLRKHPDDESEDVCQRLELREGGLKSIFASGQLSYTRSGFVEPLLPPMRNPEFCFIGARELFTLGYLVHDFTAMCRKLKKTSRIVLVDMGAALDFHRGSNMPAVFLLSIFNKFGFDFDHIYAYEITPTPPEKVFQMVPEKYLPAYHWINVGVDKDPESRLNPLRMILNKYDEDDLIIVKLDIDTPEIEIALAQQLASDDGFGKLIDQFYFEHHVHMKELAIAWRKTMVGSMKDSLDLFSTLRKKGIPAHFWV